MIYNPNYISARDDSNYLAHHGVKGMKWGVRKDGYESMDRSPKKRNAKSILKSIKNLQSSPKVLKEILVFQQCWREVL